MSNETPGSRLNLINTRWPVVQKALHGSIQGKRSAQEQILECYGKAIRRYLLAAVRDPHAADELFQDFAQRFVEGKLGSADPARGRFRDFVKGVLSNLIADYYKRRGREAAPQQALTAEVQDPATAEGSSGDLDECCREELLNRAWAALAVAEEQTAQPLYTALRLRGERPEMRSPEMAGLLSQQLGRSITNVAVRQILHRARERFADLLIDEVVLSLEHPTYAEVEQELIDLRLFGYCKAALERRAGPA